MRSTSSVTPLHLHAVSEITLLKDEGGGLMMEHGITTITFYKGDFASSADALRAQFALVVEANPWLAGRLVKNKGGVSLRHPTSPAASDIDVIFTISPVDGAAAAAAPLMLTPTVPYTKICTDLCASKMMVGSGTSLLGKNLPITLLTLTESAAGEFSLVFSLSHAVGDGRTYYEILQMLQPGASVRSLTSTRIQSFSEAMRDVCGRAELEWADKPDTQFLYTIAMLPAMLGCGKKPECVAFYLDDDRLAAAKAAAVAEDGSVAYVSTNDVITSAFFNAVGARIGMMGMDCRGRIDGIGDDLAGNYVTALTMDPDTFASPATVRKMLSTKPYVTTLQPLPTCCSAACGKESANFAMATNWSSFAGSMVDLVECEMIVHLPVKNPAHCVFDLMIPFACGNSKKGVLCWTVSTDKDGLREALPVGETVSDVLFP